MSDFDLDMDIAGDEFSAPTLDAIAAYFIEVADEHAACLLGGRERR